MQKAQAVREALGYRLALHVAAGACEARQAVHVAAVVEHADGRHKAQQVRAALARQLGHRAAGQPGQIGRRQQPPVGGQTADDGLGGGILSVPVSCADVLHLSLTILIILE